MTEGPPFYQLALRTDTFNCRLAGIFCALAHGRLTGPKFQTR